MARFTCKKQIRLVIKGAMQSVIPNPSGIPVVVNMPSVTLTLKPGVNEITDPEVIERIRRDSQYNTSEGMIEISEEDIEVINIREKKMKEAEEEIKETKKRKYTKRAE